MVINCCVKECKNFWFPNTDKSFFSFPFKHEDVLQQWLKAVPGKSRIGKYSHVCSDHFTEDDYNYVGIKRSLKKQAVPSIFSNCNTKIRNDETHLSQDDQSSQSMETNSCQEQQSSKGKQSNSLKEISTIETVDKLRRKVKILQNRLRRREAKLKTVEAECKLLKQKDKLEGVIEESSRNPVNQYPFAHVNVKCEPFDITE